MKDQKNKELNVLNNRTKIATNKNLLDSNQDENLKIYNDLKNKLKLNLKDDISNKIQRMKILYEIKTKELYRYDGLKSFDEFIKSFVIAKTQAYIYLRIYEKVLDGSVSIDKIKELGFKSIYRDIQKRSLSDINTELELGGRGKESFDIPIRILLKDKEVYDFCKENTKRLSFIIERLYKNDKEYLSKLMLEYEKHRRDKKKKQVKS